MRFDKYLKWAWIAVAAFTVLAMVSAAGFMASNIYGMSATIKNAAMLIALVCALASGLAGMVVFALSLAEVATSKKDTTGKVAWILGLVILGWLTALAYYFVGRKDLTDG